MNTRRSHVILFVLLLGSLASIANAAEGPSSSNLAGQNASQSAKHRRSSTSSEKLDLNTATKEELDKLPGIGEANAQKIIDGRPYKSKNDLVQKGVLSAATYDKIKDHITARGGSKSSAPRISASETSPEPEKPSAIKTGSESADKTSASADKSSGNAQSNSGVTAQTPPEKGMVWVNLNTKVYHREGDRWYGKTKRGKFMSEADAEKAGYRAAKTGQTTKDNGKEE